MRNRWIGVSLVALLAAGAGQPARAAAANTGNTKSGNTKSGNTKSGNTKSGTLEEVVVTATKRAVRLQRLPLAVQVLDAKSLRQQDVNNFQDYLKLVPSLTTQTLGPDQTSIYLRGVSSGDNANHSGPLPTVGSYLDEYPTTTIGGTLDVHMYDIARIETLPGPQGTLYGASSEAGTVRVITNKPDPSGFSAGYSSEINGVTDGGIGYIEEGFVNIPLTDSIAVRVVGFDEHDAGYINNVYGTRTFATSGTTINNAHYVKNNENDTDTHGGRVSMKIDLNDTWSITPEVVAEDVRANGSFGYEPAVGDLQVQRFLPDSDRDRWALAGLTVNGKIWNLDLTYAGSVFVRDVHTRIDYTDYSIAYDQAYGSGAFWQGANGQPLSNPQQYQNDKDHFTKFSNEIRLASPSTDRLRFLIGGFQEDQTHLIQQDYRIDGFAPALSVPGWPGSIWLTQQRRTDIDYAGFAEISYDITPKLTLTGGLRGYYYDNSLFGFFGFSQNYDALTGYSSGMGAMGQNCIAGQSYRAAPCVNLNRTVTGSGETHKINLSYKITPLMLAYFTYSTGYRPGGVNRNGNFGPYGADTLDNYELGFKGTFLNHRLTVDAALYDEEWNQFQFSFLGPNSLTIIENAPAANIKGAELATQYRPIDGLTLTGNVTLLDAVLDGNFCGTNQSTGLLLTSCPTSQAQAASGTQLPYTPSAKGDLIGRYDFPVDDQWSGYLQATVAFQSRTQVGLRTVDKQALGSMPAYSTLDFSTGFVRGTINIDLFVKNATDSRGQENRYVACTVGVCNNLYVLPILPRTIGLRLSQTF